MRATLAWLALRLMHRHPHHDLMITIFLTCYCQRRFFCGAEQPRPSAVTRERPPPASAQFATALSSTTAQADRCRLCFRLCQHDMAVQVAALKPDMRSGPPVMPMSPPTLQLQQHGFVSASGHKQVRPPPAHPQLQHPPAVTIPPTLLRRRRQWPPSALPLSQRARRPPFLPLDATLVKDRDFSAANMTNSSIIHSICSKAVNMQIFVCNWWSADVCGVASC